MQHFSQLASDERERLFHIEPQAFDVGSELGVLATGLGATLYTPSIRTALCRDITRMGGLGVTSMVVCLEDSIADHQVQEGEAKLVEALKEQHQERQQHAGPFPMVFIRVRTPEQVIDVVERCGEAAGVIEGFVFPKFSGELAQQFMEALSVASSNADKRFLAMPILESPEIIYHETRYEALAEVRRVVDAYRDSILALRIGATDMSGVYGLRRSTEFTVYDIRVVAEAIGAIVNVFGRLDDSFVITGPVWEYFAHHERIFRPQLRETPFAEYGVEDLRRAILQKDIDGLVKEVSLDHANGLMGKTVIHPSHVPIVHALSVVTLEQWTDAIGLVRKADEGGGVSSSDYKNKMNESKPHWGWAQKILRRAAVFGVAREDVHLVHFLAASVDK